MRLAPAPTATVLLFGLTAGAFAACSSPQDHVVEAPPPCPSASAQASAGPTATAAPEAGPAPVGVTAAEGKVLPITQRSEIPLAGPRVDGNVGDLMIDSGTATVVVTQEGRIVDYALNGTRDELVWLNPTVAVGLNNLDTPVIRVAADAGNKAIRIERAVAGKPLVLLTWVYLTGSLLHAVTVAQSTGDDPALAVTLGERVSSGNVPTWLEGHGYIKDAAKHTGAFLARDAMGVAYALCSQDGPLFAKFDEQELPGFFEAARTGESVALVPAHGRGAPRSIVMSTSLQSLGDAVAQLPCGLSGQRRPFSATLAPVSRMKLEVSRCGANDKLGKPLLEIRGNVDPPGKGTTMKLGPVELPDGCLRMRLVAPGRAPGPWVPPEKLSGTVAPEILPVAGALSYAVTEGGKPVPARLVVRGDAGTPDPDWGDDASGTGAASNVLASETGSGEVALPPGKYKVLVTRGFEYTAKEQKIEVKASKTVTVKAALDRVVNTKGFITADLHLHAVPSSDAPSLLEDRIRSLVASGIEVAVATDHNAITDYRPTIREMKLTDRITNIIGDEITTRDVPWGHFNAFPLEAGMAPIPYKDTTPSALFDAVRASKPYGKDTILQINHPRMGNIGYFEILRFDGEDIPGWLKRSPLADLRFDAIEVFNGDHYTKIHKVEEVMKDWYALLNAGHRSTATGNSDSHRVSFHEPGVPRNLVLVPDDDPAKLNERAFIDAVRAGKVVVSSGPFLTLKIGEKTVGDSVAPGEREIVATVDGPDWVDIAEVQIVKRGEVIKTWKVDKGQRPLTFKTKEALKGNDWVIAIARGKKPMPYLYRSGAIPFAFTNPIFVSPIGAVAPM